MVSLAQFVFEQAQIVFFGDILLMGLFILIVFAGLFFMSRFPLTVTLFLSVILLDGFVGFNYGEGAVAGFDGAFNDPLFIGIMMLVYLTILGVMGLGVIRLINK